MSITDLTALVQDAGKKRDHSQRIELLKKAHVLNAQGEIDSRFFSSEEKDTKSSK
ncbi:hypothetical protein [Marinicellulosiphila megalodicopiae]|uniref:hypothetical protein n=1 Tax=Marinicellulosiphila megalodicopiae TaxID=2724896 RepID=UPI003BB0EA77